MHVDRSRSPRFERVSRRVKSSSYSGRRVLHERPPPTHTTQEYDEYATSRPFRGYSRKQRSPILRLRTLGSVESETRRFLQRRRLTFLRGAMWLRRNRY